MIRRHATVGRRLLATRAMRTTEWLTVERLREMVERGLNRDDPLRAAIGRR